MHSLLGLRVIIAEPEAAGHLVDVCHGMGRMMLREAVRNTNMLAQLATHPDDLREDDDQTLT